MNGKGIQTFSDGRLFIGNFKNGKMIGNGKLYTPDGINYKGEFLNNKSHGYGQMSKNNGKDVLKGYWINGEFIKEEKRY